MRDYLTPCWPSVAAAEFTVDSAVAFTFHNSLAFEDFTYRHSYSLIIDLPSMAS